jgi:hypothetical protein
MTWLARRTVVLPAAGAPAGVEISEATLSEMIASVQAAGEDVGGAVGEDVGVIRRAMRVPVEGFARIQPLGGREQRVVGVYDMSRTGIAIVDSERMPPGRQFNVLFPRQHKRPIEVMCSARHTRQQGDAYIIGAEFGVSWLSAVAAAILPAHGPASSS